MERGRARVILPQPILSPGSRVERLSIDESGDSLSQLDKKHDGTRDRKGREGGSDREGKKVTSKFWQ